MAFNLADQYFVKALGMYDYDLEEVVENLNYALSYDPEHPLLVRACSSYPSK